MGKRRTYKITNKCQMIKTRKKGIFHLKFKGCGIKQIKHSAQDFIDSI